MPATMDIETALEETRAYLAAIAEAHGEDPPELDEQMLRDVLAGLLEQTEGQDLNLDNEEPVSYALQQGERYASQWPGPGWTYAGKGLRGGKKWKRSKQAESGDDNSLLAEHIAEWWNAHGEPSQEDMDAAAAELDGTGWGVWLNAESEQWEAVKLEDADDLPDDALVVYAAERAPKGGVTIGGTFYPGGRWIPSQAVASADPEVKSRITKAANVHKERVKGRMATREQVRAKTSKHKDKPLSARETTQAKQMLAQLIQHHGEHVVSRLDELAEQTQEILDGITEERPNDVLQVQLETKLSQIHAAINMVEERGHGEVYEEEAKKAKQPDKPKEKKVSKGRKKARTGDSLYKIIQDAGGIDLASLRQTYDIKVDFLESGLRGLLRDSSKVTNAAGQHGIKGLDEWAKELEAAGDIRVPGHLNAADHLLEELKGRAKSLNANLDSEIDRMAKQYYKEKDNAEREAGAERVAEALRDSEAAGISQAEEEADRGGFGELADEEGAGGEAGDFEFGLNVKDEENAASEPSSPAPSSTAPLDAKPVPKKPRPGKKSTPTTDLFTVTTEIPDLITQHKAVEDLAATADASQVQEVPISSLHDIGDKYGAFQTEINNRIAEHYRDNPEHAPAVIIRGENGKDYILEGRHRALGAKLGGKDTVKAVVVEKGEDGRPRIVGPKAEGSPSSAASPAALSSIPIGDMQRVNGVMVRRTGEDEYRVSTPAGKSVSDAAQTGEERKAGVVRGDAAKIAQHIESVGKRDRMYGRQREEALSRVASYEEPSFMDAEGLERGRKGFDALPIGTPVVSLEPATHGRVGVITDDGGRKRVKFEGEDGWASSFVEPIDSKLSWRVKQEQKPAERGMFDEPESAPKSDQQTLTRSTPVDRMPSSGETPTGGKAMDSTATEKGVWEMTPQEYEAARMKAVEAAKGADGAVDWNKVVAAGFTGYQNKDIVRAVEEGKPVPQEIIDRDPYAVQAAARAKLKTEYGPDYLERLRESAKRVSPIHEVIRENADGSTTIRQKQLRGGAFHEHQKGDIVLAKDGTPKIVAKAKKPYKGRHDGMTTGYFQEITLREPKKLESAEVERKVAAHKVASHWDSQPSELFYAEMTKKAMEEHKRLVAEALGGDE